jgi:hypothetical protein
MPWGLLINAILDIVVPEIHNLMTRRAIANGADPSTLPTLATVRADLDAHVQQGNAQGQAFLDRTAPPPPAAPPSSPTPPIV